MQQLGYTGRKRRHSFALLTESVSLKRQKVNVFVWILLFFQKPFLQTLSLIK